MKSSLLPMSQFFPLSDSDAYLLENNVYAKLLHPLYDQCNGGMAYESALLIRPLFHEQLDTVDTWNAVMKWKILYAFNKEIENFVFFARDIFGMQFGILPSEKSIWKFDPETGAINKHSDSIGLWVKIIQEDPRYETGWPSLVQWISENNTNIPLSSSEVLSAKLPFVFGGEFLPYNLISMNELDHLKIMSGIAIHIKDIPDGGKVIFTPSN